MYGVIMAGGSGTRFWPRSRSDRAKQFLSLYGKHSLIQSTLLRFSHLVPWDRIYIVSNRAQKKMVTEHCLNVPRDNLLFEPLSKNTAVCIGLAAVHILENDPDAVLAVSPSDHLVLDKKKFKDTITAAAHFAEESRSLVTIGILPSRPATGYGYIQTGEEIAYRSSVQVFRVKTFAEKPNLATAEMFLKSGDFLWNSGIFVFRADVYLAALEEHLPDTHDGLRKIQAAIGSVRYEDVLQRVYRQIRGVSVDYGVMEHARSVLTVRGNFLWNDLGSWEQVYLLGKKDKDGNSAHGNAVFVNSRNAYVYSSKGVVGIVGLEDVVVIQDGGAVLVCKREEAENVKLLVEKMKRANMEKYL
ncbi:mannose-1-phosphate guanylyltransferase [bacterium]|nr:mannose-1-phosphate guanylyltransferase [bacterium]